MFERFKTKTHFNSLKRLVGVTALAALAVKLLTVALATAAGGGTPLDLLARVPASLADLGAALLVFEVLRTRRPLQLAAAVLPAVVWVRRRPRRVYAAVGLVLLAPLALAPAWSPRDLVWPAVFGYLGDARWASIYAVVAGATLLWTSTWWGSGLPWHGGVDPATVASGAVAGLGLVTWVVLGSWVVLGWRTLAVEAAAAKAGAVSRAVAGAVDNHAHLGPPSATLPPGGWTRARVILARPRTAPPPRTAPRRRTTGCLLNGALAPPGGL